MRRFVALQIIFLLVGAVLIGQEAVFERSVLALYKSSDNQTRTENEVAFYLERPLKDLGLDVVYWDIDRGIPSESMTRYVRAIVTWYRGPSMRRPEAYLDFLDAAVRDGKKVVVFDNFGAYQDRDTSQYVAPMRLNTTLTRLGIMYQGDWTENGSVLRFAEKDPEMVEYQGRQDIAKSSFFYRFIPSDRDLQVHLSIERTDRRYGPSPVITTNRNGGFALTRYLYRVEGGKVNLLLNVERFLKESLFPSPTNYRVGIITDNSGSASPRILNYTESVLRRAKIPFTVIRPKDFRGMVAQDLRPFSAVALILSSDSSVDPELLDTYLREGGGIVSLLGGRFERLAPVLGIAENRESGRTANGFRIGSFLLLGDGVSLEDRQLPWTPGSGEPIGSARVVATDYRTRIPLAWMHDRHRGKVLVWNWEGFESGDYIGLLFESILAVHPVGAAAVPGVAAMFLDDWPLPMYNVVKAPLSVTDTEYYTKTWWPDIKQLLQKANLPVSSYIIFNYNATTKPPFPTGEFFVADNNAGLSISREHLENGMELGLHGYNHMSLSRKKSELNAFTWPSIEEMEEAVRHARSEWVRLFGEAFLPQSYVAPHNIISEEGIDVLHSIFPSIRVISTLYTGSGEESYFDFGRHERHPEIYLMPRTSAGFHFEDRDRIPILSGVMGPGVWMHFIHADDLFDPVRSRGDDWEEMKRQFTEMVGFLGKNYPWLRRMGVYDAYRAMEEFDDTGIEYRYRNNLLELTASRPGTLFRVRLNGREPKQVSGGTVVHRYADPPALVIRSEQPSVTIRF